MPAIRKFSFWFIAIFICLAGFLRLAAPFIAILFSYLVLEQLQKQVKKTWLAIAIYIVIVIATFSAMVFAGREAVESLPDIANRSIPLIVSFATKHGIELPFADAEGFKTELVRGLSSELRALASSAEILTRQFVVMLLALVIAVSIFVNPALDLKQGEYALKNNAYTALCNELASRFGTFYRAFRRVMGAQLVISSINTFFTAGFIFLEDLPHRFLLIVATFVCGLLPIVGNIISNTIITCLALTISLPKAGFALIFLIVLHKFEYFLNSKIIGGVIKNPMWLTLASLIVGEYAMGIPGMILAPVVLQYIKKELSQIEA